MIGTIESRRAPWCELISGATVWAPFGEHGWRSSIITGLGKNRGDHTVVHLHFDTGGGQRYARQLYWWKPELKGRDKPNAQSVLAHKERSHEENNE